MPVLECPECRKKLKVAEGAESKRFRCPQCKSVVSGSQSAPSSPANDQADRLTSFLRPAQSAEELGRLGSYRLLQVLGHGGMGVVYKAEDIKLKRPVALKAMLPGLDKDTTSAVRFLREAEAVAAISHPHVVRIFQVDEDHGVPFMAMEYLLGESLEDRLMREPILPVSDALRIGRQVAEALQATHARGLIHRDVKPSNVWLESPSGEVKLIDFGLVRPEGDVSQLTGAGVVLGTPEYMSPEQARGQKIDARTDLFSLGVLLYRMVTGQVPFPGSNAVTMLISLAKTEPQSPQIFNFDLSSEASDVILRLLAKDPAHRFQSAQETVQILAALERGDPPPNASQTTASPQEVVPHRPLEKQHSRKAVLILMAAAVISIIAVAIGAWYAFQP